MNIAAAIRLHSQRHPELPALQDEFDSLSWAAFDARLDRFAAGLVRRGICAGDVVALCLPDGVALVVAAFAIARADAAFCAIDWRSKPAERQAIVDAVGPRLLLSDRPLPGLRGVPVLRLDQEPIETAAAAPLKLAAADPESPAFLLLSSGTTGLPKATVVSHRAAAWRGMIRMANFAFMPGLRVLSAMPLSTSAGISGLLGQLVAGASIVFHSPLYTPAEIVEALQRQRTQHVSLVPTVLRWLLDLPPRQGPLLPDLTSLLVLGAAFHAEDKRAVMARISPNLFENYGSAGTGTICTATPRDLAAAPDSVGRPPLFTSVEIVDEDDQALPVGAVGRVRVRTPGAASGYYGASGQGERNEVYRQGLVYPGDLGRLDDQGRLYLEGRAANLILRGGQNLYPEEIERVLLQHPQVADAAVVGRADATLGEVPVALVVAREGLRLEELLAHCRSRLQASKVPVELRPVAALPRTAAGKIRRAELPALLA